jgi:hypothetical protein
MTLSAVVKKGVSMTTRRNGMDLFHTISSLVWIYSIPFMIWRMDLIHTNYLMVWI